MRTDKYENLPYKTLYCMNYWTICFIVKSTCKNKDCGGSYKSLLCYNTTDYSNSDMLNDYVNNVLTLHMNCNGEYIFSKKYIVLYMRKQYRY